MFTWPVEVALKGQGWSFTTEVRVNPLEQNRFLAWEAALSAPGANPTTWRKVKFMEGMDGHESVFPDKLYGDAAKGKDIHLRTRIEVRKATRFAFTRGSMSTALAVDGKVLIPVDASMQAPVEVVRGPGVHELALRRAAGAKGRSLQALAEAEEGRRQAALREDAPAPAARENAAEAVHAVPASIFAAEPVKTFEKKAAPPKLYTLRFSVTCEYEQMMALKKFLNDNNIRYSRI